MAGDEVVPVCPIGEIKTVRVQAADGTVSETRLLIVGRARLADPGLGLPAWPEVELERPADAAGADANA